jgi:hypothetical protein
MLLVHVIIDVLDAPLCIASMVGHVEGMVPHLILGGITNLAYVCNLAGLEVYAISRIGIEISIRQPCWLNMSNL